MPPSLNPGPRRSSPRPHTAPLPSWAPTCLGPGGKDGMPHAAEPRVGGGGRALHLHRPVPLRAERGPMGAGAAAALPPQALNTQPYPGATRGLRTKPPNSPSSPSLPRPGHLRGEAGQVEVSREAEAQARVVGIFHPVLQSGRHQHFAPPASHQERVLPESEGHGELGGCGVPATSLLSPARSHPPASPVPSAGFRSARVHPTWSL